MEINQQCVNLDYVEEISGGDSEFKKEMIEIFLKQIPEFTTNLDKYLIECNYSDLAKEAHTAKSSVLIFKMEDTGALLKTIQLDAERNEIDSLSYKIQPVKFDMENASRELSAILKDL